MKQVLAPLLTVALACAGSELGATTYHIRSDGGDASQCTGNVDAPYQGSGVGQACAWSHPFQALDANGQWRIHGADTVVIHAGSYPMGFGAPNSAWCEAEAAFDCHLPALPSGADPQHPTRLVGAGWDQGCAVRPQLWGTQRSASVLDLRGTANALVACLEITDHSGCVEFHADAATACQRDTYPYGEWAAVGIVAADSANISLQSLNIHGLAVTGVHAGRLRDVQVQNVRVAGNGWAGWDGDIDGDDSNAGDQIKVNGSTRIENSLAVSQCGFFEGRTFTYQVDACRAGGSALALNLRRGTGVSVVNSTVAGQGDCLTIVECDDGQCEGSEQVVLQNDIFLGTPEFADHSDTTCYVWMDQDGYYQTQMDYNVVFGAKLGAALLGSHDLQTLKALKARLALESLGSGRTHLTLWSGAPHLTLKLKYRPFDRHLASPICCPGRGSVRVGSSPDRLRG